MTRYLIAVACFLSILSCNNEAATEKEDAAAPLQQWFATDTLLAWDCTAEDKQRKRILPAKDSVPFPQAFVNGINKTYGETQLKYDRISGDTVYVSIENAEWLTNRAGSSGAEQYLSFASLNLLETKGVHYVTYAFTPGAHARPGTWSRKDFADWKTDSSSAQ